MAANIIVALVFAVLVVAALSVSGCMTTPEYAGRNLARRRRTSSPCCPAAEPRSRGAGSSASHPGGSRHSPTPDSPRLLPTRPRLPDPSAVDDMATDSLPVAAPPIPAGVAPAGDGGSFGLWSLSSIAQSPGQSRRAAPLANSGGMLADAAAGRLHASSGQIPAGGIARFSATGFRPKGITVQLSRHPCRPGEDLS